MEKLKKLCKEQSYLILAICLLLAHLFLEVIYIIAKCEDLTLVNLISIGIYGFVCVRFQKLSKDTCFWILYWEITLFSAVAVTLYGDVSSYSICVVPLIPLVCQWDYESKHVSMDRGKEDNTFIQAIVFIILVYIYEQLVDLMGWHKDASISSYYENVITYFNFLVLIIAILFGNLIWLMIVNLTAEDLEIMVDKKDYLANHDELTGLKNRKGMEKMVRKLEKEHASYGLCMGDIDYFKKINDSYGHGCGDYILTEIGKVIKDNIRTKDKVFRWGGEEFILIVPGMNEDNLKKQMEQVRTKIENSTFYYNEQKIPVTITIGISVSKNETFMNSMKVVDQLLYYGKEHGRNCVISKYDIEEE